MPSYNQLQASRNVQKELGILPDWTSNIVPTTVKFSGELIGVMETNAEGEMVLIQTEEDANTLAIWD